MKKVYLLGAGASIGHSSNIYPNITNFFEKAKEYNFFDFGHLYTDLLEYIDDRLGIDVIAKKHKLDIEELLTILVINEENNNDILKLNLSNKTINLIQNVLSRLDEKTHVENSEYNLFTEKLTSKDTIITFNWGYIT